MTVAEKLKGPFQTPTVITVQDSEIEGPINFDFQGAPLPNGLWNRLKLALQIVFRPKQVTALLISSVNIIGCSIGVPAITPEDIDPDTGAAFTKAWTQTASEESANE